MKRYFMSASNGSVVPHESDTGEWVKYCDVDYEMSTLRYEKEEALERVKELEDVLQKIAFSDDNEWNIAVARQALKEATEGE